MGGREHGFAGREEAGDRERVPALDQEKVSEVKEVRLQKGSHKSREEGVCAMEYAAYLAGEKHSDRPECVSPVLLDFMISFNDGLDDEMRQRLRPYIVRTLGTKGDGQDEQRSYMASDWLVRINTPAFLELAGLEGEAVALRNLAPLESPQRVKVAEPQIKAASAAASAAVRAASRAAASDAAWDAASAAARDAARAAASAAASAAARDAARAAASAAASDAARAAAWAAVRAASRAAASDAAWAAASAAARGAARAALGPTVAELQESAFELLDRMIDPGGIHDVQTEAFYLEKVTNGRA